MFGKLRIHIALLLCMVFVSRLLFGSVGVLAAPSGFLADKTPERLMVSSAHCQVSGPAAEEKALGYQVFEICEEDLDENDNSKTEMPVICSGLFFSPLSVLSKQPLLFHPHKAEGSGHRYLALRVFRI